MLVTTAYAQLEYPDQWMLGIDPDQGATTWAKQRAKYSGGALMVEVSPFKRGMDEGWGTGSFFRWRARITQLNVEFDEAVRVALYCHAPRWDES